jgi:hypothetical protein
MPNPFRSKLESWRKDRHFVRYRRQAPQWKLAGGGRKSEKREKRKEPRSERTSAATMDATALRFLDSIRPGDAEETWIERRLRAELPQITTQLWQGHAPGACPLADIGDYLLRILQITSCFSNSIIYGNFIHDHTTSRLAMLVDEDDGSTTDYLDIKHEALKYI